MAVQLADAPLLDESAPEVAEHEPLRLVPLLGEDRRDALTDAAHARAFLRDQQPLRCAEDSGKLAAAEGRNAVELDHPRLDAVLVQQLRRAEHVVDERAVGAERDVLPRAQLGKITGACIGGEGTLAAARIADGDRDETDVLGENNVTELDAKKVTAMLKLKMRKNEER